MKFRRLALALLVASCSDTTSSVITQLNLDRPIDIAFACYGGLRLTNGGPPSADQTIIETAMPLEACDIRSQPYGSSESAPVPAGQETIDKSTTGSSFYYGFILQSEPGTVALAQWDTKAAGLFQGGDVTVLDTDPLIPGKNGIAVGENPVAIASDTVGCFEVTANAGSCDLSTVDVTSAIEVATDNATAVAAGKHVQVERIAVQNASGQAIRAKPAAMVAEPPSGTIGVACPATATGLVYVAYPGCHLVAGIDVSTGTIVTGIKYDASGVASIVDGNVSCPDECGGGGIATAGARPITLALEHDDRTDRRLLAIGAQNSNVVTTVELDLSNRPLSLSNVVLQQNPTNDLGVTSVAISPSIGMGGRAGMINDDSALGSQMQFVYAVATDNTVRVANIYSALNKECDTQVDPRYLHDQTDVKMLSCMYVGDAATPPRRAGARGPGIQLPHEADPTSVAVFRVPAVDGDQRVPGTPLRMIGYFGVITATTGSTYVLNIDDDDHDDVRDPFNPLGSAIPLDIANQLRDAVPLRSDLNGSVAMPICDTDGVNPDSASAPADSQRFTGTTTRTLPTSAIATQKINTLPSIHQVKCVGTDEPQGKPVSELSFAAPLDVRDQEFPDLRALPYDDTWTMTYEGSLSTDSSNTAANGPSIRTSMMNIDADGIRLTDQTGPFCDAGVELYDIVQLRGCDATLGDSDCPLGYTCFVHPESQVQNLGTCMLPDESDRLANACKSFLTSRRQYTVGRTTAGELKLWPRKHVLSTTPIDGCTSDAQCQTLANYRLQLASENPPQSDNTAPDPHTYTCAVDPLRAPELDGTGAAMKRCIETCQVDTDCDTGSVCSNGTCMDGVIPPQACVNAPQRYELRASEAFTVTGANAGYTHSMIADPTGACIKNPNASPFQVGRIPLRAPACDPTANPATGLLPNGSPDANPCELTVDQTELATNYIAGTCTVSSPTTTMVTRAADAIRYRGPGFTLTLVDPTYPGDATCIGDRAAGLGKIPVVPQLFQISVRIVSGFSPLLIRTGAAFPVKVTRGPGESIWIMDEGDYLSSSITIPSTRGKVFRVESGAIAVVNTLQ